MDYLERRLDATRFLFEIAAQVNGYLQQQPNLKDFCCKLEEDTDKLLYTLIFRWSIKSDSPLYGISQSVKQTYGFYELCMPGFKFDLNPTAKTLARYRAQKIIRHIEEEILASR